MKRTCLAKSRDIRAGVGRTASIRRETSAAVDRVGRAIALVVFSTFCVAATAAATPVESAYGLGWSAAHGDAANSDYAPVPGAHGLELIWQRSFQGMINLGPTSDASRVYVTTAERAAGRLHALDITTGATLWSVDTLDRAVVASAPLLDRDGRIYLADSRAMHAFDADGHLVWRVPIDGFPLSAQFTRAGHLLFITQIGKIYVLRRSDGAAVVPPLPLIPGATYHPLQAPGATMRGTRESPVSNTPAIDLRTDCFYFTFWAPGRPAAGVRAMRLIESPSPALETIWINDALAGGSGASPDVSADGARIYLTDNTGELLALDAHTGRRIWSFPLGYGARGSVSTSPAGLIMPAGGRHAPLQAIIDRGGHAKLLWRLPEVENRGIPTQVADGIAYAAVAASSGPPALDLLVIDTATGRELDREHLAGGRFLTVGTTVAADGTVFVPTIDGHVFAFRPRATVRTTGSADGPPVPAPPQVNHP